MLRNAPISFEALTSGELFPEARAGEELPNLTSYSKVILAFSGGKDSLVALLHLLDLGVPRDRIELWHHDVDGREGLTFMDWPVTRDYCRKVAAALGVEIYFSWREGGFLREMLRKDDRTAAVRYQAPDGTIGSVGGLAGPLGTRRKFPQVSANLAVRWCSSSLKIEVGSSALRNQERFNNARTLFVTGERGEESAARGRYAILEPHRADGRSGKLARHVDHYRPIRDWTERQVWALIERYGISPHPCYFLGWGRASCAACIFGSANQWATLQLVAPTLFDTVARYEEEFGVTIHRSLSIRQLAAKGRPYPAATPEWAAIALSETYDLPVIVDNWSLPAGAYGESCGPT